VKLSYKINASFIIIAFAVVVLVIITSYTNRGLLISSVGSQNISLCDEILSELYERILSMGEEIRFVLHEGPPIYGEEAREEAIALIRDYRRRYGYTLIEEISLADDKGKTIWSTMAAPFLGKYDPDISPRYSGDRSFSLGEVYFDLHYRKPILPLYISGTGPEGARIYLIAKIPSLELFRHIEVQYVIKQKIQSKLVTEDGKLIYSTGLFRFLEDVREDDFYTNIEGNRGYLRAVEDGRQSIYGYYRIQKYRQIDVPSWYLLVGYDLEKVLEKSNSIATLLQILGLTLIILSLVVGTILSRSIRLPVVNLIRGTEKLGAGDLDTVIEVGSKDEIGELASRFNDMTRRLKETYGDLEREIQTRERTEMRLKESISVLHRTNRDLAQFAYAASHDLQEPLRSIAGFLQLIERRYKGVLDEKGKDYVRRSVEAAKRLQSIINDLLFYSDISLSFDRITRCDLNSIMDRVLSSHKQLIEVSKARIDFASLPAIYADATHMESLFYQLIGNALVYRRSEIPPRITIDVEGEGEEFWTFTVTDNGLGIDNGYLEKIFDIFQRLHQRTEYGGNGIGLAISKKIVEIYGGTIWVESKPGEGSSFFFTLHNVMEEMLSKE